MNPKSIPKTTEKSFGRDLATFERLPEKTKDLLKLTEQAGKATGPEPIEIANQIEDRADKSRP